MSMYVANFKIKFMLQNNDRITCEHMARREQYVDYASSFWMF